VAGRGVVTMEVIEAAVGLGEAEDGVAMTAGAAVAAVVAAAVVVVVVAEVAADLGVAYAMRYLVGSA